MRLETLLPRVLRCSADQPIIVSTVDNDILLAAIEWLPVVALERRDSYEDGIYLLSSVGWKGPKRPDDEIAD